MAVQRGKCLGLYYPNTGSLAKALSDFNKALPKKALTKEDNLQPDSIMPLISIVADIALHNPRHLPLCAAILSHLIDLLESTTKKSEVIDKIKKKFERVPNTGFLDIWLQRITLPFGQKMHYDEKKAISATILINGIIELGCK
jgi:hypothetical protein